MNDYMINLIQYPWTSHAYREILKHGDGDKHMVDGDGVSDDGDEEALEIPFSRVENKINQPPKMKIMVAAALDTSPTYP
jgi:hypothetical protein